MNYFAKPSVVLCEAISGDQQEKVVTVDVNI